MFHFLNKNLNFQLFLLFVLVGWTAWTVFARMTIIPADGTMLLFQYIVKLWTWNALVVRILTLLLVLTLTVGVIQNFNKHHFSENKSYLPGVFMLLMLQCGKFLYTFTPALLTVFFIAVIMIAYSPNEQSGRMKDQLFSFGLLIAIATLLDISAFGIVLFLILMIAINNVTSFKDILIFLIGLSFPYLWAFAIAFICNDLTTFTQSWRNLFVLAPVKSFTSLRVLDYVTMLWLIIVTVVLMLRDKQLLDNKLIVIRQAFNNVNLLLISMLFFLFLGIVPFPVALIYLLPPISIYMSVAVTQKRYRFLVDSLIVSLCVLLCL